MKSSRTIKLFFIFAAILAISSLRIQSARAHCDTMDGPVIMDAKKALETKNVNLVLIWVQAVDEGEIKKAFDRAIESRKAAAGRDAADRAFFETLVRVHRAGEGAGYEGLKAEGAEQNPSVKAADLAIDKGAIEPVNALLTKSMNDRITGKFKNVYGKKNYNPNDVQAGREYVKAYVEYVHYVEAVYDTIIAQAEHHGAEGHGPGEGHRVFLHLALSALAGLVIGAVVMFLVQRKSAGR